MKRRKLKNRVQKSGEGLQDYAADIKELMHAAYPELMGAIVDSFVDGICDWKVQSLVCMHSCKNTTTAPAYVLEIEVARRASNRPAVVHQLSAQCLMKPNPPSGDKMKLGNQNTQPVNGRKPVAHEVLILRLRCYNLKVYILAWSGQLKKLKIYVDAGTTYSILKEVLNFVEAGSSSAFQTDDCLLVGNMK